VRNRIIMPAVIVLTVSLFPMITGAAPRENSSELYRKGARLAIDGQLDKAILVFQKVVEVSPYYCLGHYGLGKAYLYKYGMMDEAIRHLKTSVKLDRKFVKGYFYLGVAYFMSKKYRQAASAFKSAYVNDDTYIEALYNLGVVYEIMEESYKSSVYYSKYLGEKVKEEEDLVF
jgi:tetratricopeptide (TPR) repeat protein